MIEFSKRIEGLSEYYFSSKLREVKSLVDSGEDIINLGIGSPDLSPPTPVIKKLKDYSSKKILIYPNSGEKYNSYTKKWDGESSINNKLIKSSGISENFIKTSKPSIEDIKEQTYTPNSISVVKKKSMNHNFYYYHSVEQKQKRKIIDTDA